MVANKGYIVAIIFLFSTIALGTTTTLYYYQMVQYKTAYDNISGNIYYVNVGVDYGNGTIDWYNSTLITKNTTAFDVTVQVCFNVSYTLYSFGPYITAINNVSAGSGEYWALYHNGEYSLVGAADLFLLSGDTILWVLTTY
ncbi:MAG: DUF4430 domain-containing protein [Candidatus Odinarchaeia archaeon]